MSTVDLCVPGVTVVCNFFESKTDLVQIIINVHIYNYIGSLLFRFIVNLLYNNIQGCTGDEREMAKGIASISPK